MAYDQRTADVERELETTQALLAESERMRDSLRLQVAGAEHTRRKDNEYLLGQVERLRSALREIDRDCSFGSEEQGMTPMGVREIRRVAQRALASRDSQAPKEGDDA